MIKKQYLFPEMYINKVPKCDVCEDTILVDTGRRIMTMPTQVVLRCPNCNKEYTYYENELQGEWVWKTI